MGKDCEKRHQSVSACRGISPEALHLLVSYSWPGNVRELENAIERGIALGVTPDIRPQDSPKALRPEKSELAEDDTYDDAFEKFQKSLFEKRLQLNHGDHAEAARGLDLHAKYFRRRCRALDVKMAVKELFCSGAE